MIRISELIDQLEKLKSQLGDVPVLTRVSGFGGYGIYTVDSATKASIHTYHLEENFDSDIAEMFFPECAGDYELFKQLDEESVCVQINDGAEIYTT